MIVITKDKKYQWFYGVTVSTLDFESIDPSSNLGRTSFFLKRLLLSIIYIKYINHIYILYSWSFHLHFI